jgi:ComF family protein
MAASMAASSLAKNILEALCETAGAAADLLFPPRCLTCGALAQAFCAGCRSRVRPLEEDAPVPEETADARSAGYHEGELRRAVLLLKFSRKTALARPLGELLAAELEGVLDAWQPDALVPVPIHWTRRLERGFNQSELIAEAAARRTGVPALPALRRTRRTPPQVGQSRDRRAHNIRGAFAVEPRRDVAGKRLVLVDDVRTTGSTLAECARVLREADAAEVFALTVTFEP